MGLKIIVIAILFLAEAIAIYSEIIGAKYIASGQAFWPVFWRIIPMVTLAGIGLLLGYMFGIKAFQNIWIVGVISITSILILEPILAYSIFKQLPTKGAAIGLMFGALGFAFALFWK